MIRIDRNLNNLFLALRVMRLGLCLSFFHPFILKSMLHPARRRPAHPGGQRGGCVSDRHNQLFQLADCHSKQCRRVLLL